MRYSQRIIAATLAVAAGRVGAQLQIIPGEAVTTGEPVALPSESITDESVPLPGDATETAPALEPTTASELASEEVSVVESTSAVIATGEPLASEIPLSSGEAETTAEETEAPTEYPELVLETTSSAAIATEAPAVETTASSAEEAIPTLTHAIELAPTPTLTTSGDVETLTGSSTSAAELVEATSVSSVGETAATNSSSSVAETVGVTSSSSSATAAISGTEGIPTSITAPRATATAPPLFSNGTAVLTSLDSTGSTAAIVTASASVPGGFLRGSGGGAHLSDGEASETKAPGGGVHLLPSGPGGNSNNINRNGTATAPFPVPSGAARATGSPLRLDSSVLPSGGLVTSVLITASPSSFGSGRFGGGSDGFGGAAVSAAGGPLPTAPGEGGAAASQSPISSANESGAGLAAGVPSLALVVAVGGVSWLSWFLLV